MSTDKNLSIINVFPSAETYETNKASITENEISLVKVDAPYVVAFETSGDKWYRKWSDGWIEQGGIIASVGGSYGFTTQTFLIPFTTKVYSAVASQYGSGNKIDARTVASVTLTQIRCGYEPGCSWYVCGY